MASRTSKASKIAPEPAPALPAPPHAAVPAPSKVRMIGYKRVNSPDQNPARQLEDVAEAGLITLQPVPAAEAAQPERP